jgi:hypothetical protein
MANNINFYDRKDCLNLSPYIDEYGTKSGIFVFKKIIPESLLLKIEKEASDHERPIDYEKSLISWYSEKTTEHLDGLHDLWEIISEILSPGWVIHPSLNLLKVLPGDNGMFIHSDSPGKNMCHRLSQLDIWSTCCELDYGVVAYLGNWEGGAIFYPNIKPDGTVYPDGQGNSDDCFEFMPERGDLVIHSAFKPYEHGVREVTSGTRYAFSCFSLKKEDNPGTFYNYGTEEYYNQIGNKSVSYLSKFWIKPLIENPQFSDERIKEYKDSGLKAEELTETFFSNTPHENFKAHLPKHSEKSAASGETI